MKFFIRFQPLIVFVFLITAPGCSHQHEKDQVQDLIDRNLAYGSRTDDTLLGIKFGDSHISYQKKLDSLYQHGIIYSLVPDSSLNEAGNLSYYRYYHIFNDYDALKKIKWIFSPTFKDNRLVELALLTTPILDKSLAERSFNINKGILKNLVDTSGEVMEDADVTYRITKAYFNRLYGTPEFVSENRDQSYWFKGNCVISVANTMTAIKILFKNSESK